MGRKTPPFEHYPAWTQARFWAFVRSKLRQGWQRWPPKYECLTDVRRKAEGKGRLKWEYQCSQCKEWFAQKEVEVDHIEPCGSLNSYEDAGDFIKRLFVGKDKLRVVCKPCHKAITHGEKDGDR